jgi:hypothetical protein
MSKRHGEYEGLLGDSGEQDLSPPVIPGRAKESIAVAALLCFLDAVCFTLFVGTFS